ncbi:MAG: hypothetical protein ACOYOK_03035 [Pseudobdellovibrionaceae bacterium]
MSLIHDLGQLIPQLKLRNEALFYFGIFNFALAFGLLILSFFINIQYLGTHALYKPIKFGLSIGIYSWTMSWFCFYLGSNFSLKFFNFSIISLLGFEIVYIAIQALRGQGSHYNLTNSFYGFLYVLMALAATLVTLWTFYIGILFCTQKFQNISEPYLWGIRLGIFIFVIFSFQGFIMGSRLSHTVGGPDTSEGYLFLNWSKKFGDLRISHFLGMHALQILPFLAHYVFKSNIGVITFSFCYFLITSFVLYVTMLGKALL